MEIIEMYIKLPKIRDCNTIIRSLLVIHEMYPMNSHWNAKFFSVKSKSLIDVFSKKENKGGNTVYSKGI